MQSHAESWHKLRCCHFLVKSVGQFKLKERERETNLITYNNIYSCIKMISYYKGKKIARIWTTKMELKYLGNDIRRKGFKSMK